MTKKVKLTLGALLLIAAACAAFLLLRPRGQGTVATVKQNGEVLYEIDLSALTGPVTLEVEGENGLWNIITAEPGRICVQSAACPDQICVHQGYISDGTTPIVCLPNKLIIEIIGGGSGLDAATG